ncbi:MAG: HAD-IB family phosphatase [Rickettsiales bacterium]|jgi:D-3-phosphoglycerate dehydrogenase|nr:HAD-IB family phosphatase [Rickettsiales bacterium]
MKVDIFVIDFDSTFVSYESLALMVEIALKKHPKKRKISLRWEAIGNINMKSEIDFKSSLKMKIEALRGVLTEEHLTRVGKILEKEISPDIVKIVKLAKNTNKKVISVSNSFKFCMKEVMKKYGVEIYFANKHFTDKKGFVIGYDETNPMANNDGKSNVIRFLKNVGIIMPEDKIMMIGDGMSDLKVYQDGLCDYFMDFSINKNRKLKKHKAEDDKNFFICRKSEDVDAVLKVIE